jgi:hypothetical protein
MRLRLTLEQADVDALRSLRSWLADEPAVRRHAQLGWTSTARPGELGPGLDVLTLAVSTGLSVLQLLLAVAQWRASRPQPPTVMITRTEPDGATVRIEATDPQTLAAAAEALEAR